MGNVAVSLVKNRDNRCWPNDNEQLQHSASTCSSLEGGICVGLGPSIPSKCLGPNLAR